MFLITRDDDPIDLTNQFVCSDCWEGLVVNLKDWTVTCVTPDCPCRGASRLKSVIRRESENATDLASARSALRIAAVRPARRAPDDILNELGF